MMPAAEASDRVSEPVPGSFRDPCGRVVWRGGQLVREIYASYAADYERLRRSGLYDRLVEDRLLIPHVELADAAAGGRDPDLYKSIAPEVVPFISHPFEWAFNQLKLAALLTLRIQKAAVSHGMVLKDASAFNVQFRGAEPVFIDTLSFERWSEGTPWVAYRQFCQHFLGPLALMSLVDARLGALSREFIDGPPLDLVSRLLPARTKVIPSLLIHLHLHARAQTRHGASEVARTRAPRTFTTPAMLGLVDSLAGAVERLVYAPTRSPWVDYYSHTNYSAAAMAEKERLVAAFIDRARPATVWDLGANTGAFSRIAAVAGAYTIACDGDHAAVDRHFLECRQRQETRVLPLVMDLANPTGRLGWNHVERESLADRGPADLVLALGLIHHLVLSNQVPFHMAARFFAGIGRMLAIEFVPRNDSQVQGMLSRMPRLDAGYTLAAFEEQFSRLFTLVEMAPIAGSERRLYLFRRKEGRV